jgi:hypothetical protein
MLLLSIGRKGEGVLEREERERRARDCLLFLLEEEGEE